MAPLADQGRGGLGDEPGHLVAETVHVGLGGPLGGEEVLIEGLGPLGQQRLSTRHDGVPVG